MESDAAGSGWLMSDATRGGLIRGMENDGLYTPSIKEHSLRKIRLHNYYVRLIATAMKNVLLYYLVLYSEHPLARAFWNATRVGTDRQLKLF